MRPRAAPALVLLALTGCASGPPPLDLATDPASTTAPALASSHAVAAVAAPGMPSASYAVTGPHAELALPKAPATCPAPATATALAKIDHDDGGYDLTDDALVANTTITLSKNQLFQIAAAPCVRFAHVAFEGGRGLQIAGGATVLLEDVTIRGEDAALEVWGSANVVVRGGTFASPVAMRLGGDAVAISDAEITGRIETNTDTTFERTHVRCDPTKKVFACVDAAGNAVVYFHEGTIDSSMLTLNLGGGARVTLENETINADAGTETPTVQVMGGAIVLFRKTKIIGHAPPLVTGGGGEARVESGFFDPPLHPRYLER